MAAQRTYLAIDLKSFYASVECVDRHLDPLTTNLVVADASRTEKTICLAVSPSLKAYKIPGRARLFEAVQRVREVNAQRLQTAIQQHKAVRGEDGKYRFASTSFDANALNADPALGLSYIVAPPRMQRYLDVSTQIYKTYLRYVSPADIYPYSIDEVFIDVTGYLPYYHMSAHELAMTMVREVLYNTGITATAGIGTNLYLAKLAMDIVAKHIPADKDGAFGYLYFCVILTFFSLIRRYKAETLWKNSFLHDLTETLSESTFRYRITIGFVLYLAYNVFMITVGAFMIFHHENSVFQFMPFIFVMIAWIAGNLLVFYFIYRNADQTDKIHAAIEKLASGETSYKVDVNDFSSLEAELAEGLNRISDGLETALAEQVKSERLKADLITNVSHDIKTPLTSIINYVDLIKRQHIEDPTVQKYLEVLDQKSQRLKTLTEDLVEASRASSGNIKLEITNIDFVELVQQTTGEFEEKYAIRHLEIVNTLPNEVIMIEADGRRLWRVLENLYNNAFKYALEGTRVYVTIEDHGADVVFTIKNVSANPLNISPDELTERFVRGDVSRTTEGSGLGLSIAKDLTTLQGGKFELIIDGDLFKAQITFPIKN